MTNDFRRLYSIAWLRSQQMIFPFRKVAWQIILLAGGACWGCLCDTAWIREEEGNDIQNKMGGCFLRPQDEVWCLVMKKICPNMPDSDNPKVKVVQNLGKRTWPIWTYLGALHLVFGGVIFLLSLEGQWALIIYLLDNGLTLHSNMTSVNSVASTGE